MGSTYNLKVMLAILTLTNKQDFKSQNSRFTNTNKNVNKLRSKFSFENMY